MSEAYSPGRTPPGVRELKHRLPRNPRALRRRTPPGVRELKLLLLGAHSVGSLSHPSRGA